jgi:hypothetical protein
MVEANIFILLKRDKQDVEKSSSEGHTFLD